MQCEVSVDWSQVPVIAMQEHTDVVDDAARLVSPFRLSGGVSYGVKESSNEPQGAESSSSSRVVET